MQSRPRILFVANRILGWSTYSSQVAKVLDARDDVDSVTYWRRPSPVSTAFVKRHDLNGRLERVLRRVDPINAYRGWLGRGIRRMVRLHRPDIVHFASHWPAGAMLGMRNPPPFTLSLDSTRPNIEDDFHVGVWSPAALRIESGLLHRARRLYPMSSWVADSLRQDFGIAESAIHVVPPAQDLDGFLPKIAHDGLPNILFVGNDFHRKGGQRLVEWVNGPLAGRCHLHIVSGDPSARIGGPHVTCHGRLPHDALIGALMPKMDIACLPTQLDMAPNVLVEAAAAGLPAVTSRLGGIADIVLHGQTGFLAERHDDPAFIAALDELITSPQLRARMGRAAQAHASRKFDGGVVFNRMIDDICSVSNGYSHVCNRFRNGRLTSILA